MQPESKIEIKPVSRFLAVAGLMLPLLIALIVLGLNPESVRRNSPLAAPVVQPR